MTMTIRKLFQQDHNLINYGCIVGDFVITQDDCLIVVVVFDKSFGGESFVNDS